MLTQVRSRTKNRDAIQREYFRYLCGLVKGGPARGGGRVEFLWFLHKKPFYCIIDNDENRSEDGKQLWEDWSGEELNEEAQCSVLEMLIGLAKRIDYILADSREGDRTAKWFWEMVGNLGLEEFTDRDLVDERRNYNNDRILDILIERLYSASGRGGLFPLRRPDEDQRRVEIWYQMQAYLEENYSD
jgi:hypothetical protein